MANDHDKLSDVLSKSEPLLGRRTTSFQEAYPTISKLRVEVVETELVWPKEHGAAFMTEQNFRQVVNCSNPHCYGGGIDVGSIIHTMAFEKQTHYEDSKRCRGNEGSPKGRRIYRSCIHKFIVKADIEFKTESPKPTGS